MCHSLNMCLMLLYSFFKLYFPPNIHESLVLIGGDLNANDHDPHHPFTQPKINAVVSAPPSRQQHPLAPPPGPAGGDVPRGLLGAAGEALRALATALPAAALRNDHPEGHLHAALAQRPRHVLRVTQSPIHKWVHASRKNAA